MLVAGLLLGEAVHPAHFDNVGDGGASLRHRIVSGTSRPARQSRPAWMAYEAAPVREVWPSLVRMLAT